MKLNWLAPHGSSIAVGIYVALLVAIFGYVADTYAVRNHKSLAWDDVVVGIVMGVVILIHEERRTWAVRRQLRVILDMNCFVREQLRMVPLADTGKDKDRMGVLENCVDHIDWALRELLPRKAALEESEPIFEPKELPVKRPA